MNKSSCKGADKKFLNESMSFSIEYESIFDIYAKKGSGLPTRSLAFKE
jgi:hypothetical protein